MIGGDRPEVLAGSDWLRACPSSGAPFSAQNASLGPTVAPTLAPPGEVLQGAGGRWPTNQWWTSIISRPNEPLWSFPVAVRIREGRAELSAAEPVTSSSAIVTPFEATLTLIDPGTPNVVAVGDFHVVLQTGVAQYTIAQGSPAVWVDPVGSTAEFIIEPGRDVQTVDGPRLDHDGSATTDHLIIDDRGAPGWDVVASTRVSWKRSGDRLTATWSSAGPASFGLVARPAGAGLRWTELAAATGRDPVAATLAEYQLRGRDVLQRLTWQRRHGGTGLVTLLPHHRLGAIQLGESISGQFPTARGTLHTTLTDIVEWAAPLPELVLDVPQVELTPAEQTEVLRDLQAEADRATQTPSPVGSYFGPKLLGRLATLVDVSSRYGTEATTAALLDALQREVLDWATFDGDGDRRWFGYDAVWGGMQSSTSEFGAQDYNDHHFQFGYLIQAAATLITMRPSVSDRIRPLIDLLIADIGVGQCRPGFPRVRVVNAYEGHSYASGFAPFADGNNQESSSEAVHAWWSITRWGLATGQNELAQRAVALYATEAATARMYWLGEDLARPAGFDHDVSGIVWGAKVDFATFFDARPASVVGIQLLPFTFGSWYRNDPQSAATRYVAGSANSGDHWQDLLALELAIADPERASEIIDSIDTFEEGNSRAFARVWIAAQRQRTRI